MNLRVNLLADEERRSASPIRAKTVIQVATMLAIGLVTLWAVFATFSISQRRSRLKDNRWKWQRLEADYVAAVKTRADLQAAQARIAELAVYQRSRVDWALELRKIGAHTPTNVQLTELRVSQSMSSEKGKAPSRAFVVRLQGRTSGPAAEPTVRAFFTDLGAHPDFTNLIASAAVPAGAFRSDTSAGASEADRVFEIICIGKPRTFE